MATQFGLTNYFTIPEAANELGITPAILKAYLRQGRLKGERVGAATLIREQELKAYRLRLRGPQGLVS